MSNTFIRNSTAEFLIFTGQTGEQSIEARYESETVGLSQKLMAELFAVDVRTISEHLKNIFEAAEVQPEATVRKFRIVQTEEEGNYLQSAGIAVCCPTLSGDQTRFADSAATVHILWGM